MTRPSLLLLTALLSACGTTHGSVETGPEEAAGLPSDPSLARVEVAALEDRRDDGGGRLVAFLEHEDVDVRRRAAAALGRLPRHGSHPTITRALAGALDDRAVEVRTAAAFALGQRGDPDGADALLGHGDEPSPAVRAAVVEALSRLAVDQPALREEVLYALDDPSPRVRLEVATGAHRWPRRPAGSVGAGPGDDEVDSALVRLAWKQPLVRGRLVPLPDRDYGNDPEAEDADVIWRALFSLQRRESTRAREVFLAYARATEPAEARVFAVKGLRLFERDEEVRATLEECLTDPDWRVVVEALRCIGSSGGAASQREVEAQLRSSTAHVRAEACRTLARLEVSPERARMVFADVRRDRSTEVRCAALVAQASLMGSRALPELEDAAKGANAELRAAAAEGARAAKSTDTVPLLLALSRDPNPRVAGLALEGLGDHPSAAVCERLTEVIDGPDVGLRLAALGALPAEPAHLPAISRAFERTPGATGVELRAAAVERAASIVGDASLAFLRTALADPSPFVRDKARAALVSNDALPAQRPDAPVAAPAPALPNAAVSSAGTRRPIVEISTTAGQMSFELFPDDAPVHVWNFIELARSGHYDNLTFHRVVADFVVQGGCHRGDGNGVTTWRGEGTLRHEFSPRKFVRGSIGMPRSEDLESGGSQFFVTHRPTPHLDGRYTLFGQLRTGGEVLDSIEVGDRILNVRVRD